MSKELRKLKYEISLLGHSKEDLIGVTMRLEELESKLKEAEEQNKELLFYTLREIYKNTWSMPDDRIKELTETYLDEFLNQKP